MVRMWWRRLKSGLLTASLFERAYARRSGVTVAVLHERGRRPRPCDCGDKTCDGWRMGYGDEDDEGVPFVHRRGLR